MRTVDLTTIFGILVAMALISSAISMGGNPKSFIDLSSIMIVVIGTLAVTTACFSVREMLLTNKIIMKTVLYNTEDNKTSALRAIEVALLAQREGLLALEKHEHLFKHNRIFLKAINMLIDSSAPKEVQNVMHNEIAKMSERHQNGVAIIKKAGEISPSMGLIGTLIGLVQMLGNLEDPSSIGPAMALALLTTFYGAVMAFVVFYPLAAKLEKNSDAEILTAEIYSETINAIINKTNARQLEIIINSLLPPSKRIKFFHD